MPGLEVHISIRQVLGGNSWEYMCEVDISFRSNTVGILRGDINDLIKNALKNSSIYKPYCACTCSWPWSVCEAKGLEVGGAGGAYSEKPRKASCDKTFVELERSS